MDQRDLIRFCRSGDLDGVQRLVEKRNVDVNVRDMFDSTPLYYACLCGHFDTVKYLLEVAGARCDTKTFDGERCMYGALTSAIRTLLISHQAITSTVMRRDSFEEFLRQLFEQGNFADVEFIVENRKLCMHKCILAARSPYFRSRFTGPNASWRHRSSITIKREEVKFDAFYACMQFLYTGRMEIAATQIDACRLVAKQCQVGYLCVLIDKQVRQAEFFARDKHVSIARLVVEIPLSIDTLRRDMAVLAYNALPEKMRWRVESTFKDSENGENSVMQNHWFLDDADENTGSETDKNFRPLHSDVDLNVSSMLVHGHKAFFCGRSDYFNACLRATKMLQEIPGSEQRIHANSPGSIETVELHDVSARVFSLITQFIYCDRIALHAEYTDELLEQVLLAADMYLVSGLKRECAKLQIARLKPETCVRNIKLARLFNLVFLEDRCCEFVAKNLDVMIRREDFRQLVVDDARAVVGRQATDTIDVIDNVRYYISNNLQTYAQISEADEKLKSLDNMLEELELDA